LDAGCGCVGIFFFWVPVTVSYHQTEDSPISIPVIEVVFFLQREEELRRAEQIQVQQLVQTRLRAQQQIKEICTHTELGEESKPVAGIKPAPAGGKPRKPKNSFSTQGAPVEENARETAEGGEPAVVVSSEYAQPQIQASCLASHTHARHQASLRSQDKVSQIPSETGYLPFT
jgi:hypothetical protein